MNPTKKRVVYFSHGGGPLPLLGDPGHKAMIDFMRVLPEQIARQTADATARAVPALPRISRYC